MMDWPPFCNFAAAKDNTYLIYIMPKEKTIARWLPLVGLTFAVFVFNTSEFMPIGLLSDIAADLHISEDCWCRSMRGWWRSCRCPSW